MTQPNTPRGFNSDHYNGVRVNDPTVCIALYGTSFVCVCPQCTAKRDESMETYQKMLTELL